MDEHYIEVDAIHWLSDIQFLLLLEEYAAERPSEVTPDCSPLLTASRTRGTEKPQRMTLGLQGASNMSRVPTIRIWWS